MVIVACRTFRSWAVDSGYECPDFIGRLKGPPVKAPERGVLTPKQIQALLERAASHAYLELPIALAAYMGMALGDLTALQWAEVDLDAALIIRERRKTGRPMRIPIVPPLLTILKRRRAISGPVCRGMPESDSSLLKALNALQTRAGIPPAPRGQNGWHRYRHSLATLLME